MPVTLRRRTAQPYCRQAIDEADALRRATTQCLREMHVYAEWCCRRHDEDVPSSPHGRRPGTTPHPAPREDNQGPGVDLDIRTRGAFEVRQTNPQTARSTDTIQTRSDDDCTQTKLPEKCRT